MNLFHWLQVRVLHTVHAAALQANACTRVSLAWLITSACMASRHLHRKLPCRKRAQSLHCSPQVVGLRPSLRSLCYKKPERCANALCVVPYNCSGAMLAYSTWATGPSQMLRQATGVRNTQRKQPSRREDTWMQWSPGASGAANPRRIGPGVGRHICFPPQALPAYGSGTPPAAALQPVAARHQSRIAKASQSTPGSHAGLQPLATCWGFRAPAAAQPARDGTAAASCHDGPCASAQDRR